MEEGVAEPGLAGAQPQIEKVDIGSFGTFYSLRIGPFPDKAESLKVCNALKRSGIDCSLADHRRLPACGVEVPVQRSLTSARGRARRSTQTAAILAIDSSF